MHVFIYERISCDTFILNPLLVTVNVAERPRNGLARMITSVIVAVNSRPLTSLFYTQQRTARSNASHLRGRVLPGRITSPPHFTSDAVLKRPRG